MCDVQLTKDIKKNEMRNVKAISHETCPWLSLEEVKKSHHYQHQSHAQKRKKSSLQEPDRFFFSTP